MPSTMSYLFMGSCPFSLLFHNCWRCTSCSTRGTAVRLNSPPSSQLTPVWQKDHVPWETINERKLIIKARSKKRAQQSEHISCNICQAGNLAALGHIMPHLVQQKSPPTSNVVVLKNWQQDRSPDTFVLSFNAETFFKSWRKHPITLQHLKEFTLQGKAINIEATF